MCLGAIYWARPRKVYFAATQQDAAQIGFDDQFIYNEIAKDKSERMIEMSQLQPKGYLKSFEYWDRLLDKNRY